VRGVRELSAEKILVWASWDGPGVVSAALQSMLADGLAGQATRMRLLRATGPEHLAQLVAQQAIGLAVWIVGNDSELLATCKAIDLARSQAASPVCVCFVKPAWSACTPILLEAGAQIVVHELPSLQRVLPRILASAPFSSQAGHPLTTGLIERLPWQQQDDERRQFLG
jgi:hypothetical protein